MWDDLKSLMVENYSARFGVVILWRIVSSTMKAVHIRRLEKYLYMHDLHFQGLTNPHNVAGMEETANNRLADSD